MVKQLVKQGIQTILDKSGIVLSATDRYSHFSMTQALKWLSSHSFQVNTVLDVGASNGSWSKACLPFFPNAHYVLFEPQPAHNEALDTFAIARKQQISLVKKAVGAAEGETFFDETDPFGGQLTANGNGKHSRKVPLTTIDSSVSQLPVEGPYLLKLDTHGVEKGILEGASETLKQANVLIIEAYNYKITKEALLFWELCAFLAERGFRPVDLVDVMHRQRDGSLWQMDLIFAKANWEGFSRNTYR